MVSLAVYTNQNVVPYNPYLLLTYECHINVEIVTSMAVIKYMLNYMFKGNDPSMCA